MRGGGRTLVECTLVLGLLGGLAGFGAVRLGSGTCCLTLLAGETRVVLDQAFLVARARGGPVRVVLGSARPGEPAPFQMPLRLPRGVGWGLPAAVAPPPGVAPPRRAHLTGAAHPVFTVTPRGTATAGAWYLSDGREALYLGLSGRGRIRMQRWRGSRRGWQGI